MFTYGVLNGCNIFNTDQKSSQRFYEVSVSQNVLKLTGVHRQCIIVHDIRNRYNSICKPAHSIGKTEQVKEVNEC